MMKQAHPLCIRSAFRDSCLDLTVDTVGPPFTAAARLTDALRVCDCISYLTVAGADAGI